MATENTPDRRAEAAETVTLVDEVATVSTREVLTGRVRVTTHSESFEELAEAALRSDKVEVTRVAIDKPVDRVPQIRTEGDVTIVPVMEEILVVEKRLILKEELHIHRTTVTSTVSEPVTLRRQRAQVERLDEEGTPVEPTLRG